MAIMFVFSHMGKLVLGRHIQWKDMMVISEYLLGGSGLLAYVLSSFDLYINNYLCLLNDKLMLYQIFTIINLNFKRAIQELFKVVHDLDEQWAFTLTFSMLEIYNETILDLLDSSPSKEKLDIRQTPEGNVVVGLIEIEVIQGFAFGFNKCSK